MVGATFHPQVPLRSQGIVRRKSCVLDAASGDMCQFPLDVHRRLSITHTQSTAASVASAYFSSAASPMRSYSSAERCVTPSASNNYCFLFDNFEDVICLTKMWFYLIYSLRSAADANVDRFLGAGGKHSDCPKTSGKERDKDVITEASPTDSATPLMTPNMSPMVTNESIIESCTTTNITPIANAGSSRFGAVARRLSLGSGKDVKEPEISPSSV